MDYPIRKIADLSVAELMAIASEQGENAPQAVIEELKERTQTQPDGGLSSCRNTAHLPPKPIC